MSDRVKNITVCSIINNLLVLDVGQLAKESVKLPWFTMTTMLAGNQRELSLEDSTGMI